MKKSYRKLFMHSKQFQKYNVSSEELISMYPYKGNKKRVQNSRTTKPLEEKYEYKNIMV
ncbi:MAG: hypothetical protein L6V81_01535 [Clostridium sp.]|nr:MAG: hypothetical protein L6V81_01535 [Clostridium sp.]